VSALSGPFVATALVLCAAGIAKLRSPEVAARALGIGRPVAIRSFAAAELGVGAWAAVHPTVLGAALVGGLYALFAVLAAVLVRRRLACGCFGFEDQTTSLHVGLSAVLALVAAAAAVFGAGGIDRMATKGPYGTVLLVAAAACAYALVLVYTALPRAWQAWSAR
jgi:hypothetical protein